MSPVLLTRLYRYLDMIQQQPGRGRFNRDFYCQSPYRTVLHDFQQIERAARAELATASTADG
jgi:hypothetical protein